VPAQSVTNPHAAEGGADGESGGEILARGPEALRHRRRALSAADYESLARQASPAVAAARALPVAGAHGRPAPGWVRLIIVPQSQDPQPAVSWELRRRVHAFISARAPASVAGIVVVGAEYQPIGVDALVAPRRADEAGVVGDRVRAALLRFLHPLTGGPEGRGWPFGRGVHVSDVAVLLEGIDGVDYVARLTLTIDDTPRGDVVPIAGDRIVAAGAVEITLTAAET
jgi:predicted phage baseplate assembly protein